jgi:outer membrane immunogenic protein
VTHFFLWGISLKKFALSLCMLAASAASALAADLPARVYTKAPVAPPVVVYNWTGCYVGGNGGGLWVRKDWRRTITQEIMGSHDADGGLGGAQAGCNYQTGNWVFGIQGDYAWTNASGSNIDLSQPFVQIYDHSQIDGLGSVTGRAGYAWDRFLAYVKGGGAWERDRYSLYFGQVPTLTLQTLALQPGTVISTAAETRQGWTVGVGGEYVFWKNLSGFIEYDYYGFGTRTNTFTNVNTGGQQLYDIRERKSVVKAGLNWKFDWAQPVVAKY